MPGTTAKSNDSVASEQKQNTADDVDLDRTVWYGEYSEVYHRDSAWGPACAHIVESADEHTLSEAAVDGLRACKQCEPVSLAEIDGGDI